MSGATKLWPWSRFLAGRRLRKDLESSHPKRSGRMRRGLWSGTLARQESNERLSAAESLYAIGQALLGNVPSPTKITTIDRRQIESHAALAVQRQSEASTAARLDQFQTKVPQYPKVDGRSIHRLGYHRNEVIRRAFDLLVESLTQALPELQDLDGRPVTGPDARQFQELMLCPMGPDSDITGMDTWVRFWLDAIGTGNGMLEMVPGVAFDRPVRLVRMDPIRTHIIPHETERIERYVYEIGGRFFDIPRERVIHFRTWDPLSDFWGIPPLYSALKSLATDSDLVDLLKVTFQNLGVPPAVLEYPLDSIIKGIEKGVMGLVPDKDQLREIRDQWAENQEGQNRGKTGLAWGFQVKLIGLDFQKLAIGELVATTERRLLMAHGINPLLVGQTGTAQQKGHNFRETLEFFFSTRIRGLLAQSGGVFSARLATQYGTDRRFGWRTDQIGALRDARLRRGSEAGQIFRDGLLTRHSCQRLMGEPEDGPDIFYPDVYGPSINTTPGEDLDEPEEEDGDV